MVLWFSTTSVASKASSDGLYLLVCIWKLSKEQTAYFSQGMGISALLSYGFFCSEGQGDGRDWRLKIKQSLVTTLLSEVKCSDSYSKCPYTCFSHVGIMSFLFLKVFFGKTRHFTNTWAITRYHWERAMALKLIQGNHPLPVFWMLVVQHVGNLQFLNSRYLWNFCRLSKVIKQV